MAGAPERKRPRARGAAPVRISREGVPNAASHSNSVRTRSPSQETLGHYENARFIPDGSLPFLPAKRLVFHHRFLFEAVDRRF